MQKTVKKRISARRQKFVVTYSGASNIVTLKVEFEDFGWSSPRRIVQVRSQAPCLVEDLLTRKTKPVQVARIKYYGIDLDASNVSEYVLDFENRCTSEYSISGMIVKIR